MNFNIRKIMELLPHRYPFLMVDKVLELEPGKRILARKCVSVNEPFFQGHFPDIPVMPGVMIVEALAQAGGIMVLQGFPLEEVQSKIFLFTGIENVKFRRPVYPGDCLELSCEMVRQKFKVWKMSGKAYVDGVLVAEAELSAAVTDRGDV